MTFAPIDRSDGSVEFWITVQPRASRSEVVGTRDDTLLVRVTAPPFDGKANTTVVRTLADALDVPARRIAIVAGARQRRKRLRIADLTSMELFARLERLRVVAPNRGDV